MFLKKSYSKRHIRRIASASIKKLNDSVEAKAVNILLPVASGIKQGSVATECDHNQILDDQTTSNTAICSQEPIIVNYFRSNAINVSKDKNAEEDVEMHNLNLENTALARESNDPVNEETMLITESQKYQMTKNYKSFLQDWITNHKCLTRNSINDLLRGMKTSLEHISEEFPIDSRTLMKNTSKSKACDIIKNVAGGRYCHFGLLDGLNLAIKNGFSKNIEAENGVKYFNISLFIDGLQIHNSTFKNFWVILASINGAKNDAPFCIGLYYSEKHHPSSFVEFLDTFIEEYDQIREQVFLIEDEEYRLSYDGPIICDLPAKSDVKGIKGHSGFYSCDKCVARGLHHKKLYFPFNERFRGAFAYTVLRTDANFRNRTFLKHHREMFRELGILTAFEKIVDIDMVS